jgi:hypothetical protein
MNINDEVSMRVVTHAAGQPGPCSRRLPGVRGSRVLRVPNPPSRYSHNRPAVPYPNHGVFPMTVQRPNDYAGCPLHSCRSSEVLTSGPHHV